MLNCCVLVRLSHSKSLKTTFLKTYFQQSYNYHDQSTKPKKNSQSFLFKNKKENNTVDDAEEDKLKLKKKELLQPYLELINEYKHKGNKMDPTKFTECILKFNIDLLKNEATSANISHIFKSCVPFLLKYGEYFIEQNVVSNIIKCYSALKIHRKDIFNVLITEWINKKWYLFKNKSKYPFIVLRFIIELQHKSSKGIKQLMKNQIVQYFELEGRRSGSLDSQEGKIWILLTELDVLKYFLIDIDKDYDVKSSEIILRKIEAFIELHLTEINLNYKGKLVKVSQKIFELTKYRKLEIHSKKLATLFEVSMKMPCDGYEHSSERIKNIKIKFVSNKEPIITYETNKVEKDFVVEGGGSIFEKIFEKHLYLNGYTFEKNVIIGSNEYDFKITGKSKELIYPFAQLNMEKFLQKDAVFSSFMLPAISEEECRQEYDDEEPEFISINEKWKNPVILNLNGPSHFINSDEKPHEEYTRTDEIKGQMLKLYGYSHYNIIDYKKWEHYSSRHYKCEEYIKSIIETNILQ